MGFGQLALAAYVASIASALLVDDAQRADRNAVDGDAGAGTYDIARTPVRKSGGADAQDAWNPIVKFFKYIGESLRHCYNRLMGNTSDTKNDKTGAGPNVNPDTGSNTPSEPGASLKTDVTADTNTGGIGITPEFTPVENGGADIKPKVESDVVTSEVLTPVESGGTDIKPKVESDVVTPEFMPVEKNGADIEPEVESDAVTSGALVDTNSAVNNETAPVTSQVTPVDSKTDPEPTVNDEGNVSGEDKNLVPPGTPTDGSTGGSDNAGSVNTPTDANTNGGSVGVSVHTPETGANTAGGSVGSESTPTMAVQLKEVYRLTKQRLEEKGYTGGEQTPSSECTGKGWYGLVIWVNAVKTFKEAVKKTAPDPKCKSDVEACVAKFCVAVKPLGDESSTAEEPDEYKKHIVYAKACCKKVENGYAK